jgi:hypothetical protein
MRAYCLRFAVAPFLLGGCQEPSNFDIEVRELKASINCGHASITPGDGYLGRLFSCIGGDAETVKLFVNEDPSNGDVKNIKFLWNDWSRDRGYGLHADLSVARQWLAVVGKRYSPENVGQVIETFFNGYASTIVGNVYTLNYTFEAGPAIDERMFVITLSSRLAEVNAQKSMPEYEYEACRLAIEKQVKYSKSIITGDGKPIQNSGFVSYELSGMKGDLFACDIYANREYRLKAAYGGALPYLPIGGGTYDVTQ